MPADEEESEAPDLALDKVVEAVERTVHEVAPSLHRVVKYGAPTFQGRGDVLTIGLWKDFVSVGFWAGAKLAERHSILEGAAQGSRMVKLRTIAEARTDGFKALVRDAAALDQKAPVHRRADAGTET